MSVQASLPVSPLLLTLPKPLLLPATWESEAPSATQEPPHSTPQEEEGLPRLWLWHCL